MLIAVVLILGLGTYMMRLAGVVLRDRLELSEQVQKLLPMAAAALLAALAASATLIEDGSLSGIARPAGVLVGALLASRRAPFVVVVVAAAAVAALLRLAGVH